jgi:hypothetical protein
MRSETALKVGPISPRNSAHLRERKAISLSQIASTSAPSARKLSTKEEAEALIPSQTAFATSPISASALPKPPAPCTSSPKR